MGGMIFSLAKNLQYVDGSNPYYICVPHKDIVKLLSKLYLILFVVYLCSANGLRIAVLLPELVEVLSRAAEQLETMQSLLKIKSKYENNESMLYSIKEVEIYLEFVSDLYRGLEKNKEYIQSDSFKNFYHGIREIWESEEFQSLKSGVSSLSHEVTNIHSVTLGINLDSDLQPYEAGCWPFMTGIFVPEI